ncbi:MULTISPECIES: HIT family protein [unclassified Flavobacterium]|uniref:HIT family protein n=1 Tax=unclassified Flavobacterium TaxID=196869 RepID=UPI001F148E6B|nr:MULTISPECIES: HIT family protein [unclassified Flavobacterium]UMY66067.1 HIT family protein [Flavobacterium sp. HJ-32-4]
MASIFTRIINREIPGHIVSEDDRFIAILDVNPNTEGHTLCIPKTEINKLFDMEEEHYLALMAFSRKVAQALEKAVPCKRIGVAVVGLEVPHVHVHLIPLHDMDDMRFQRKVKLSDDDFKRIIAAIQTNL